MSELARKLAAMKKKAASPAPPPRAELVERAFSRPMDPRILQFDPQTLARMGLEGEIDWESCAFLDTETTGLSGGAGTVAFLVGIGRLRNGVFTVTQVLMPDYSAEPMLLQRVEELLSGARTLITFNGRSFDVPLLRSRRVMCRMGDMGQFQEWDLLYPSRRVWKMRLQSCRLARIEDVILGLGREDDLPGSEVPQRYFDFLKTGNFALLEDIMEHNRQDVLTMETLLAELHRVYAAPSANLEQMDLFSLGKVMEKQKEETEARACYQRASIAPPATSIQALEGRRLAAEASLHLARVCIRSGDYDEAEKCLEKLAQRPGFEVRTELAKLYEHRKKDLKRALRYAALALEDAQSSKEKADGEKRVARLKRKLEGESYGIF